MDRHDAFDVWPTPAARELLRSGEALVLDRHRLAVCCARAREKNPCVRKEAVPRERKDLGKRSGLRRPGYLPGRDVGVDTRKMPGFRPAGTPRPRDRHGSGIEHPAEPSLGRR